MASIRNTALAFLHCGRVDQWEMLGILGKESSVRLSNWIKTLQFEQKKGGGLYG